MLISKNWIKEFVELPENINSKELSEKLTLSTAEVEEVKEINQFMKRVKVVEVVSKEKHPEADKLNLVTFKTDVSGSLSKVVCGASNVEIGMKAAYAPTGTLLPNGLLLEPKKIRGVLSEGMLCSEEELGLSEESEGIIHLKKDSPIGIDMLEYFNLESDLLFDIDNKSLTHRPDLWGHYGFAREFSTIFGNDLKKPFDQNWQEKLEANFSKNEENPIQILVDEDSSCLAYFGLSLQNIQVTESPDWLKNRLVSLGLRSINSIVDISNYVMLELGIPLHIFDADKIEGKKIHIKKLDQKTKFTTLDEIERELIESDTVIMDSNKPLVLAGVMGGMNSGVSDDTTHIFIEVANWNASEVRQTSTRLGLRTDSSQRYEKSLDSNMCYRTLLRTLDLILELCPKAKVLGQAQKAYYKAGQDKEVLIETSSEKISKTLGYKLSDERVINILNRLEFKVTKEKADVLKVIAPSFRSTKDVECEADIIEEIGRIIGYDNIDPVSPKYSISPVSRSASQKLHKKIRDFLALNSQSFEVQTYPMIGESLLKKTSWRNQAENLKLINSLSVEHDRMRDSLIPSFLEASQLNAKSFDRFRFFECSRVYQSDENNFFKEKNHLGVVFYEKENSPFLDLLSHFKKLLSYCDIPYDLASSHPKFKNEAVDEEWQGIHPYENTHVRVMGKMKGMVFSVHPLVLKKLKIKGHLSMAILDLTSFQDRELKSKIKYQPISKFTDSHFDYTLSLSRESSVDDVLGHLKKYKNKKVTQNAVVDIYEPDGGEDIFVTFRSVISQADGSLKSDELKSIEEGIIAHLNQGGFRLKA